MAKRKKSDGLLYLDLTDSEEFLVRMARDYHERVREAAEKALLEVGAYAQEDVIKATQKQYLPAKGIYSQGDTKKAAEKNRNPELESVGGVLSVPVGFPKDTPNAGAYLINGTNPRDGSPRRAPAKALRQIFGKKYMNERREHLERRIAEILESEEE